MKAKIIFIEVEESRLQICKEQGNIQLFKKESDGIYQVRDIPVLYQPIKTVLVGEGKIKKGDHIENDNHGNPWVVITQDTEELYEDIANGELVENVWYEFEEEGLLKGCDKDSCWLTDECTGDCINKLSTPLKVVSMRGGEDVARAGMTVNRGEPMNKDEVIANTKKIQ